MSSAGAYSLAFTLANFLDEISITAYYLGGFIQDQAYQEVLSG